MIITTIASGSTGNCYYVSSGQSLLIECGINTKELLKSLGLFDNLSGCLISHEHKDHCKSVDALLKIGIDCYMSQGTADALELSHPRVKILKASIEQQTQGFTVLPIAIQHDANEPLGFLIRSEKHEKLLYVSDAAHLDFEVSGVHYFLLECNYSNEILRENVVSGKVNQKLRDRIVQSHLSLDDVLEFLARTDLSQTQAIHLIHMSKTNANKKQFKQMVQELTGRSIYV